MNCTVLSVSPDEQDPYQNEWNDLVDAIRNDKPYNEVPRGVRASVAASMGRMAAHTGLEITFDEALNHDDVYAPGVENFTMDSPPPLRSGPDGAYPSGALVRDTNGSFYGTTESGGTNSGSYGTVFKITPSGVLTTLASFDYFTQGSSPVPGLARGEDGNYYGTAYEGGTNGVGAIFRITPDGVLTPVYSFTGGDDGKYPWGGLVKSSDGNFYGTASKGGAYGNGAVFRFAPGGSFATISAFDG